jgi:hypothetical protein
MGGRIFGWTLAAAAACALLLAPAAGATFHLIKVREVHPGSGQDSYVELQMYAGSQTFLTGHTLTVYNAAGTLVHSSAFSGGVANGQNQATVLVGDSGVQSSFGVAPDLVDSNLALPASGGAACWNAGGLPADCVAWGNFSGGAALQTATGTSVGSPVSPGGVTAGKAIRRSLEPGCTTLLEEADDSDKSATDFSEATPAPRNNGLAISETTCAGTGGGGSGLPADDHPAPQTTLRRKPAKRTRDRTPTFRFASSEPGSRFECKLDRKRFPACASPFTTRRLSLGAHRFQVRAVGHDGVADPTPSSYPVQAGPPRLSLSGLRSLRR